MNKFINFSIAVALVFSSCAPKEKSMETIIDEQLAFSAKQYVHLLGLVKDSTDLPRTADSTGRLITSKSDWWCSGFVPGTLWYLYESSKDQKLADAARNFTARVEKEKFNTGTHDLGFMLYCSFGNGLRLTADSSYRSVLLTGAKSLSTRFKPVTGVIQSWNASEKWQYPVIIDNMMNLEFLMWAFRETGDSTYYNICVSHSDTTIKNHFRADYSCYHVVSYDTISGKVHAKNTWQGFSDESAWARGQSWGLYGYTAMYRDTKLERYLEQAKRIADFLINHPNMPEDKIPYWDFNASDIPNAKRDASAAAVMASGLIELSGYVDAELAEKYLKVAETQLRTLSSAEYTAKEGENGGFIIKHNVGSLPHKSEVDVPLTYADYYYIEALLRYKALLNSKK